MCHQFSIAMLKYQKVFGWWSIDGFYPIFTYIFTIAIFGYLRYWKPIRNAEAIFELGLWFQPKPGKCQVAPQPRDSTAFDSALYIGAVYLISTMDDRNTKVLLFHGFCGSILLVSYTILRITWFHIEMIYIAKYGNSFNFSTKDHN